MSLQDSTTDETIEEQHITPTESNTKLSVSLSEVVAWFLVSTLTTVLFKLQGYSVLHCCGCLRRDRPEIQVLTTVLQSMKWRATLVMKPLHSNRPLTHISMKQSEGEGPSEREQMCAYRFTMIKTMPLLNIRRVVVCRG